MTNNRSVHFQTCVGVFQGGGCRAAAYVGAVQIAQERGVHFSSLAGTSAGAIVAALLGAGANASQLQEYIKQLDFISLLSKPEWTGFRPLARAFGRVLKLSPFPQHRVMGYALSHQGQYSSKLIEDWLESKLQILLPDADRPIRFSALPIATSVVAGDLLSRRAKIWSSDLTPQDEVKRAVRASCSIPFFFQPVDRRYIDGGVVSNLPTFVHTFSPPSGTPLARRILAFALYGNDQPPDGWNAEVLVKLLADTVVDGNQDIQGQLVEDVY